MKRSIPDDAEVPSCGSMNFNPEEHMCCGSTLYLQLNDEAACCGDELYYPFKKTEICIDNKVQSISES